MEGILRACGDRVAVADTDDRGLECGQTLQRHVMLPLLGRDAAHPEAGHLSEADVRRWHAGGREGAVWTVDDPEVARRLRTWGVDTCITNRPGALRAGLDRA